MKLPPRARRIPDLIGEPQPAGGTTSACAENTSPPQRWRFPHWNYLRVRGEYCMISIMVFSNMELPPRARRIHGGVG